MAEEKGGDESHPQGALNQEDAKVDKQHLSSYYERLTLIFSSTGLLVSSSDCHFDLLLIHCLSNPTKTPTNSETAMLSTSSSRINSKSDKVIKGGTSQLRTLYQKGAKIFISTSFSWPIGHHLLSSTSEKSTSGRGEHSPCCIQYQRVKGWWREDKRRWQKRGTSDKTTIY